MSDMLSASLEELQEVSYIDCWWSCSSLYSNIHGMHLLVAGAG